MKETYNKIDCVIKASTDRAFLIAVNDEEHWIPRSCCMNGHKEFERGDEVLLHIAQWKCEELELI